VQTPSGLAAAWFGGTKEGTKDVVIWFSRREKASWSAPVEVANGVQADGSRHPCWNPVLYQPAKGPLLLFYKVGPSPSKWWGMLVTSHDDGKTWGTPKKLPDGIRGPIKNKPVELPGGVLLCPSSSEEMGWRVIMERTPDLGKTWEATEPLNDGKELAAIQPSVLFHGKDRLQILCRSKQGKLAEAWSEDGGKTWSKMTLTDLPNPSSGTDAITLKDGRHLLVYNPTQKGRTPLSVAISADGKRWTDVLKLEQEPGEYSYPAVIQTPDGQVHITYTWKRQRIKHVVLDPAKLKP
jgi:predicted neuraminidase